MNKMRRYNYVASIFLFVLVLVSISIISYFKLQNFQNMISYNNRTEFLINDKETYEQQSRSIDNDNFSQNKPRNSFLPRRLIAVFGLEASGTKIVTEAISIATGAYSFSSKSKVIAAGGASFHGRIDQKKITKGIEIQHLSLPWGSTCQNEKDADKLHTLPVLVPRNCGCSSTMNSFIWGSKSCQKAKIYEQCVDMGIHDPVVYPNRFFINITSHIQWYEERGVEATAVILLRDQSAELIGKRDHCTKKEIGELENRYGLQIIAETLENLSTTILQGRNSSNLVLVSYESMISLGDTYFTKYLYPRLGIDTSKIGGTIYTPSIHDGNRKYMNKTQLDMWPDEKNKIMISRIKEDLAKLRPHNSTKKSVSTSISNQTSWGKIAVHSKDNQQNR